MDFELPVECETLTAQLCRHRGEPSPRIGTSRLLTISHHPLTLQRAGEFKMVEKNTPVMVILP